MGRSRSGDGGAAFAGLGLLLLLPLLGTKTALEEDLGSCLPPAPAMPIRMDDPSSAYLGGTLPPGFADGMRYGRECGVACAAGDCCTGLAPGTPGVQVQSCCWRETVEPCGVPRSEPRSEEELEPFRLCLGGGGKNVGTSKRSSIVPGVPGRDGGREGGREREENVGDNGEGAWRVVGDLGDVEEKIIVGMFGVAKGLTLSRLCEDWREIVPRAWLS